MTVTTLVIGLVVLVLLLYLIQQVLPHPTSVILQIVVVLVAVLLLTGYRL